MPHHWETIGPGADRSRVLELERIRVIVPPGWEARMRRATPEPGGVSGVVTHGATVPLTAPGRGDYGSGVVELLTADDVFVSLVEFGPEAANTPLFPPVRSIPRLDPSDLQPNQLQRILPGQGGKQHFFTYRGRPFCLYVVVGSMLRRAELADKADEFLSEVEVLG